MSGLKVFLNGAAFWTFFIGLTGTVHAELILYYSFEDSVSAGGTVVNLVNPGVYNGTLQDGAYTNGVLNLDGSGDFLQTALPTNNLGAPVTFSFWMKASDTSSLGRAIISGYTDHINRWDIQLSRDGDQKVRFIHHEGYCGPVSNTSISTNTWYHVAVVHNSNTDKVDLYVNGILETSALIGSSLNLCTGINMRVGQGDRNNFWGQIDDVAIWNNEALSSGQIRGIAQQAAVAIADGDWSAPETWFRSAQGTGTWQRLPDSGVDAVIAGGRTVTISSGTAAAKNLVMGAAGEMATVRLAGGTLNLAGNIQGTGVDITFNFHSGTLNLGGSSIGLDRFLVGTDPGANAQFTLGSGKSLTTGTLAVGGQGTGVFNFTGSGLSANKVTLGPGGTINVSAGWTYTKVLEVQGGTLSLPAGALYLDAGAQATLTGGQISISYGYVGYQNSPLTTFSQTGGTFSVQSDLAVGRQSAAQGLYTLVDGLLEV
ncbi:MAG TPA: LamG domain-containing protein, partial [Thermoguttaceae bacterium]|nr:LamG domain-containing protein [Thermoguttaceae bacterium]